jgi:RNA polymerase sigma-70 factor (ECF subfamily)
VHAIVSEQTRPTDELLLARARRGDAGAFVLLLRESDESHRRLAFRLLGDRQRLDDVLQEAYASAFRALPRFGGRASFGTWLYRIVYNACLDDLRRGRGRREVPLAERDADPAAGGERIEERLDLEAALAALPVDLRAVVLLVDAEGLSYEEAAEVLGVAAGTIGSRLNRARAVLRAALTPEKGV